MRIIGGRDYYDIGLSMGRDEKIVFLRNGDRKMSRAEVISELKLSVPITSGSFGRSSAAKLPKIAQRHLRGDAPFPNIRLGDHIWEPSPATVILCGKIYNGIVCQPSYGSRLWRMPLPTKWIWSFAALKSLADQYNLTIHEGRHETVQSRSEGPDGNQRGEIQALPLPEWFGPLDLDPAAKSAIVENKITIMTNDPTRRACQDKDGIVRNWLIDQPTLSAMEFAKAVEPYTCFQEISMFKAGVLGSDGPPIVEITDDKIKIAKAGFHHPTSFRRPKASR